MFDATSDTADERVFAERCEEDRHHFRFIVSPEDAAELGDLKTLTRELMLDVEWDPHDPRSGSRNRSMDEPRPGAARYLRRMR
jgi:hypothetical protein